MWKVIVGAVVGMIAGAAVGMLINWSRHYLMDIITITPGGPERLTGIACGAIVGAIAGATQAIIEAIREPKR